MGGRGSGGTRVGSGRKSKGLAEKVLHGTAGKQERRRVLPAIEEFECPADLDVDARHVWWELSPHAFQARTLTRATSYAFRLLCRNIVLERKIAADPELMGGANHRGLVQRIDSELKSFMLSPMGKPLIEEVPKVDDGFTEFETTVN